MKRLLWLLGLVELVWTEDDDGTYRLRIVRTSPFGRKMVRGRKSWLRGELMEDGRVCGSSHMRRWIPYRPKVKLNGNWMKDAG